MRAGVRRRVGRFAPGRADLRPVALGVLAAAVVAVAARSLVGGLPPLAAGVVAVGVTGAAYLGVAAATGSQEVRGLWMGLRRRAARTGRPDD